MVVDLYIYIFIYIHGVFLSLKGYLYTSLISSFFFLVCVTRVTHHFFFPLCIRFRIGLFQNKCRAVGAAIFGKDGFVNFTVVSAYERFLVLQNQQVDMLARVTTHTMERDIIEVRIAIDLHLSLSLSLSLYSHTRMGI